MPTLSHSKEVQKYLEAILELCLEIAQRLSAVLGATKGTGPTMNAPPVERVSDANRVWDR